MNTITKAIILAGGKGQRLQPLTFAIPKPLLPVSETPILELLLTTLKQQGFSDVILAVGYKAELIKMYFGDGTKLGMRIQYYDEKEPLNTAGPVRFISDAFGFDEDVLLINGDLITTLEFSTFVKRHQENRADLTVATATKSLQAKYGVVQTKGDAIISIQEKPTFALQVSAGIYIMNKTIIDLIPPKNFGIDQLITAAIASGKRVEHYPIEDYWMAVDLLSDMEEANIQLKDGKLKDWVAILKKQQN